jgi:ABC-2 type transport system ATP-binding protein
MPVMTAALEDRFPAEEWDSMSGPDMTESAVAAERSSPLRNLGRSPAISAVGLRKAYGRKVAVDAVSLDVAGGTIVGVLGPNGAGKTTLIRMLSTVLAPDAGSFTVAGAPHTDQLSIRRRIGVLPESAGYPRSQTCAEWLVFHARLYGSSRRAAVETASRLLAEVGLGERAASLIGGLSRGMRQRLGIARALVNDPAVVFLDEPTLGLDPKGQRQVLDLVTRIARDHGVTVALSTHVLDDVEQICDRVMIMSRGRVVAEGTVAEVVRMVGIERRAVVQVPPGWQERAVDALRSNGIHATPTTGGAGEHLTFVLPEDGGPGESGAVALRCLLASEIPVLCYSVEGGRLTDAFLAVTQEVGR